MMKFVLLSSLLSVCLLYGSSSGESEVVGSNDPVTAVVGQDVILPCHLKPPFDVHELTVEWKRNKTTVHAYRSKEDDPDSQDESFKHRTVLFHDEMVHGNISLKLFNVTEKDEGNYTCFVPKLHSQVKKGNITLNVVPKGEDDKMKADATPDPHPTGKPDENNLSDAAIGVIVVTVIIAVIIALIGYPVHRCKQRQQQQNNEGTPAESVGLQERPCT